MKKSNMSNRLLDSIKNSSLTYPQLEKITGIPKSAIQRYATGETKKIPSDRLNKLSLALNVSTDYLLGLTDDKYDFAHKNTFEEIVYIRICDLASKLDISNLNEQDKNLIDKYTFSPTTPVYEELCRLSEILNTSVPWIIGMVDTPEKEYYYADPMSDNWGVKYVKEEVVDYMSEPKKPIYHYAKLKDRELSERVNIAYNVLISLGIDELLGKSINQYSSAELLKYYSIIINYLKGTTRLFNFDKLIKEEINVNSKITNEPYILDFFVAKDTSKLSDVSNEYQFEKYIAYLLTINDYDVQSQTTIDTDKRSDKKIDMIASKENEKFYIECKFYKNKYNYDELKHSIKKYLDYYKINKNSLKCNNVKYKTNFVIATNLEDFPVSDDMDLKIWDKKYINKLEKNAK